MKTLRNAFSGTDSPAFKESRERLATLARREPLDRTDFPASLVSRESLDTPEPLASPDPLDSTEDPESLDTLESTDCLARRERLVCLEFPEEREPRESLDTEPPEPLDSLDSLDRRSANSSIRSSYQDETGIANMRTTIHAFFSG